MVLADQTDVCGRLRHMLVTAVFDHGAKLRPEYLRQELNCSATTVREALFRLSTEGLVEFQEQRGFRVPARSGHLLAQLVHLRILLEGEGVSLSIRNGGVAWEARLAAAHHQLSHIEKRIHGAQDVAPLVPIWFRAELEFHETLIAACESDVLKKTHLQIYAQFRQQLMFEDLNFRFISANIQQHHDIMVAALDGDAELARARIHDHLKRHLGDNRALLLSA